jgi:hypothetical protein
MMAMATGFSTFTAVAGTPPPPPPPPPFMDVVALEVRYMPALACSLHQKTNSLTQRGCVCLMDIEHWKRVALQEKSVEH